MIVLVSRRFAPRDHEVAGERAERGGLRGLRGNLPDAPGERHCRTAGEGLRAPTDHPVFGND